MNKNLIVINSFPQSYFFIELFNSLYKKNGFSLSHVCFSNKYEGLINLWGIKDREHTFMVLSRYNKEEAIDIAISESKQKKNNLIVIDNLNDEENIELYLSRNIPFITKTEAPTYWRNVARCVDNSFCVIDKTFDPLTAIANDWAEKEHISRTEKLFGKKPVIDVIDTLTEPLGAMLALYFLRDKINNNQPGAFSMIDVLKAQNNL